MTRKIYDINYLYRLSKVGMFNKAINWRLAATVIRIYERLTARHSHHKTGHIGAFAGSYLAHGDWDHK